MTPAAKVVGILIDNLSLLPSVVQENIQAISVNEDSQKLTSPLLFVTEIRNDEIMYGNDDPIANEHRIQLQIYYPKDWYEDMTSLEGTINQILRRNHYLLYSGTGHEFAPDDGQMMITYKYKNREIL